MAQTSPPDAYTCANCGIEEIISSTNIDELDSENADVVRGSFELNGDARKGSHEISKICEA
jgi:hypothetical protein